MDLNKIVCQRKRTHKPLLLLKVQTNQIAVVLLCDGLCLEYIVFKLLFRSSGIHDEKCKQEHSLILALQLLKERLGIFAKSRQIRRNDIHIVSGTDCLFLLLDLATVKLRDGMLYSFDGFILIHRLYMHGHDLA